MIDDSDGYFVKEPTLAIHDKYGRVSGIFLGDEVTEIIISGQQSMKMGKGIENFKRALSAKAIQVGLVEATKALTQNNDGNDEMKKDTVSKPIFKQKADNEMKHDNEEPIYAKLISKTRVFEEASLSVDVSISVKKIATALVTSIGLFASNGALAPLLAKQLEDAVINASWSSGNSTEDIVEHFFDKNAYIFFEMKRNIKESNRGLGFIHKKKIKISCKTSYFFVEASSDAAKRQLQEMQKKHAQDAFDYIKKLKGWNK